MQLLHLHQILSLRKAGKSVQKICYHFISIMADFLSLNYF